MCGARAVGEDAQRDAQCATQEDAGSVRKGCLNCEICEHKTELSGSWVDGTKLVDDSLSENFHKMGSFLISKIDGVRLAANPRSEEAHDILEFRGLVRG